MAPSIRKLTEDDSLEALTALLHRAYARLGAMGLNYTAVDQSPDVTRQRATRGVCYVALENSQLIGTITVQPTDPDSECAYFKHPSVATARQFAVDPSLQGAGLGSALLAMAEAWAAEMGYSELAVDTAEPAQHLVELYLLRGYRSVGWVQWPGKTYRSVVLSKAIPSQG